MTEQEKAKLRQQSINLGAVIEYRQRVLRLQFSLGNMLAHLEYMNSTDKDFLTAIESLACQLPSKIENAEKYIEQHKTAVERGVNKLLEEV